MGWAPPPPPPPVGAPVGVPGLASWGQRFGASVLDFFLVMVPFSILLGALGLGSWETGNGANYSLGNGGTLISMATWFAYTGFLHQKWGQTLGKKIVKIRVVAAGGQPLGTKTWIRSGVQTVLWITCLGGLLDHLWPLWDQQKQSLHDKAAGTWVVRA
jgi:uncharacterized RDD family membrane protein YckC